MKEKNDKINKLFLKIFFIDLNKIMKKNKISISILNFDEFIFNEEFSDIEESIMDDMEK